MGGRLGGVGHRRRELLGLEKNALKKQEPLIAALLDEARAAEELRLAEARPRGLLASPSGSLFTAGTLVRLALLPAFLYAAVRIRLFAVINYGYVIHEFDPWFNYRAAEYMVRNGWDAFQAWYDHECWYPLGRHVGSTTYPGLQLTAWAIYEVLQRIMPTSLNDVCVLIPAGFGAVAALFTGALAAEVSGSANAGVAAAGLMAILPAHLMRSVAGGFDNESIAITVRPSPRPSALPFAPAPAPARLRPTLTTAARLTRRRSSPPSTFGCARCARRRRGRTPSSRAWRTCTWWRRGAATSSSST